MRGQILSYSIILGAELSLRQSVETYSFGFAEPNLPKISWSLLSPDHSPSGRRQFVPSNKDSVNNGRSTGGLLGI